jgi:hypothetical protein
MYDREDEYFRMSSSEQFKANTIYVSDDIFFLVRKNYERFKEYDTTKIEIKNQFCYIGFFDTVNVARAKAFNVLFKENSYKVPMKIFGKGTEILTKFKDKLNVDIEEGFIKGDSEEYFNFLNTHLAYIFIGKGQTESRYIGKTVYDAIVARTPVAVYKKCDSRMITFENPEFYFENERELRDIFNKLQDLDTRERWISEQYSDIMRKLPPSTFAFSKYAETLEPMNEELYFKGYEKREETKPKKESSIKSVELF